VALGYPYVINTPLLVQLRPAMQSLADRFEGAVSVGVTVDLDVVYVETCAHEQGTLKRPGVGAVRGIVETAMGRAWLAQLTPPERNHFLARAKQLRPDEYMRSTEGLKDSLANYGKRGFSINMGDAGLGVLAVGVASNIRYGPRKLLFNCAVPGYRAKPADLLETIGPALLQLVNMADRQVGLR
jgi:DNA-binding IclR family transcriptional regulator